MDQEWDKMTESTGLCRRRRRQRPVTAAAASNVRTNGSHALSLVRLRMVVLLVVVVLVIRTTTAAAREDALLDHTEYNKEDATFDRSPARLLDVLRLWCVPADMLWRLWCHGVMRMVALSLMLCVAYALGWIHRLVWWLAEREASKLLNGTKVTIGSLSVDVLRGRYAATNVIVHAPRPDVYHWQAPIVARIGQVHVEANVVACLLSLWLLWQEIPIELYTVHVQDVQVFVERQCNMYNFLLLDPHVIVNVPTPPPPIPETSTNTASHSRSEPELKTTLQSSTHETQNASLDEPLPHASIATTAAAAAALVLDSKYDRERDDANHCTATSTVKDSEEQAVAATAQHVVSQVVHAVRQAAQHGHNPAALWEECRHSLTTQLKQWQERQHVASTTTAGTQQPPPTTATSTAASFSSSSSAPVVTALHQGLSVLKHVTAHLTATTHQAQKVWVPQRTRGEKVVYGRIGRVVLRQARIFVRTANNNHNNDTAVANHSTTLPNPDTNATCTDTAKATAAAAPSSFAALGWNPPILIERVIVRPHEFCPPRTVPDHHPPQWFASSSSSNGEAGPGLDPHEPTQPPLAHSPAVAMHSGIDQDDDDDDELEPFSTLHHRQSPMPALYQPLPLCIDVVIQRVLAEVAKSNTGRLFQTALSEMADVLAAASQNAAAVSSSATTTPQSH
jgi:hypothetical protein